MRFHYVHHGAGLSVTVEQPDDVHAKNNLHVRCAEEGWPVDGWMLEPTPPTVTRFASAGKRYAVDTSS